MLNFHAKLKKPFLPIFPYYLGFSRKVGPKNPGGMVFAWKVNKKLLDMDPRDPKGPKKAKIGEASKLSR